MKKQKQEKISFPNQNIKKVTPENLKDFLGPAKVILSFSVFGFFIALFLAINLWSPTNINELPQTGSDNTGTNAIVQSQGDMVLFVTLLIVLIVISVYILVTKVFKKKKPTKTKVISKNKKTSRKK